MKVRREPPEHLAEAGRQFVEQICREYAIDSAAEWAVLVQAAECLDRLTQARHILAEQGMLVKTTRGGERAHPMIRVEHDTKTLFSRLVRELRLLVDETPSESRLPRGRRR